MNPKRLILVTFLAAALLTFPWLAKDFSTRGEPREAIVAQDIVRSGNWVLPSGYGGVVPSKPPFLHWLIAAVSLPEGRVTEFSARLPSAIAFVLLAAGFAAWAARRRGAAEATLSAIVLLGSVEWVRGGITCRVDTVLACAQSAALMLFFEWTARGQRGVPWPCGVLLAAAVLTKGPIGILLPGAIMGAFLLSERSLTVRSALKLVPVAVLSVVPYLVWFALAYRSRGEAFYEKFYFENFTRFSGSSEETPHSHIAPVLWASFLFGLVPWSLVVLLPALVGRIRERRGLRSIVDLWRSVAPELRFSILAVAGFVAFFSLPSGKRGVYLLPCYPFAALILASIWANFSERESGLSDRIIRILLSLLLVTIAALLVLLFPLSEKLQYLVVSDIIRIGMSSWTGSLAVALGGACAIAGLRHRMHLHRFALGALASTAFFANGAATDAVAERLSPKPFSRIVGARVEPGTHLYSFGTEFYSMSFYLERKVERIEVAGPPDAGAAVLVLEKKLDELRAAVGNRGLVETARSGPGVINPKDIILLVRVAG